MKRLEKKNEERTTSYSLSQDRSQINLTVLFELSSRIVRFLRIRYGDKKGDAGN